MGDHAAILDQERLAKAGVSVDQLREHGHRDALAWNIAHRPTGPLMFQARIDAAQQQLEALFDELNALPTTGYTGPNPLLEIRENPRLLRAVIAEIYTIRRKIERLPRTVHTHEEEPRSATVAAGYLAAANSFWDGAALRMYVNAAQQADPMQLAELWTLATLIKFVLLERILSQADALLHAPSTPEASDPALLTRRIKSLREIGFADWPSVMEPLVAYDVILQKDPAQAYPNMDFDSRERYRKRVAAIAKHSEFSEVQVAQEALKLAQEAQQEPTIDARIHRRHAHIGYYLIDRGFNHLRARIGYRPSFIDRLRMTVSQHADDFFIGGIEITSVVLIAVFLFPLIPNYPLFGGLTVAFILLLLPVTQGAVDLFNNTVTVLFKAYALPKLDFSKGIPAECATLVAVPTLLINENQVRELVQDLQIRFLANQDPNLHFALLTDLPDSVTRPRQNDTDPLVELAIQLINDLNAQYTNHSKYGSFILLHRHRIFNARQGVWMGWERKRGKLLDLNNLLQGQFDAFPVKAGNVAVLNQIHYIITLDSDTQLPRGTAHSMIGAMAHPLNRAIIDPQRRIVTEGYGIMQPRVGVSVHSASRSRLAAIYSGQTGFDIYTRAVSDAYQDLYGEGIFTGKGIYEVSVLHAVLDKRFPRNSLLSHDLIEGAYARAGLATDIEVIDDYPSHYSAYTRRKHRWVRGDWQIVQWIFSRVPDESGRYVRNPISTISRWKIFDNLRRSLVEPFTFILLLAGWLGLPGGALYWTLVTLFLLFVPTFVQLAFSLGRAYFIEEQQQGAVREALAGFSQSVFIALLNLAFLPHQTMLSFDAIIRSLVRRFITGQRLLEWETAAEAESTTQRTTPVDRYLAIMPLFALAIAILVGSVRPSSLLVAAPILVLWGFVSSITLWLNSPPREQKQRLKVDEDTFLREQALRIWRFFYEFGGARHNYLIPDNVEEDGLFEAARVSTTNFGLLLNARQAACEFGFLTVPEFASLMHQSFASYTKLEKYRGHPYNWYSTHTLAPLKPVTVSSVDNGNLAASFYTVHTGALELLQQPLLPTSLFQGLETHWKLLLQLRDIPAEIRSLKLPAEDASFEAWVTWILQAELLPAWYSIPEYTEPSPNESLWWLHETHTRIESIAAILREYLPWLLPEYAPLRLMPQLGLQGDPALPSLLEGAGYAEQLSQRLARMWATISSSGENSNQAVLIEKLRTELTSARQRLAALVESIRTISTESLRFAEEMDFAFLVQEGRLLLSIGYDVSTGQVHEATYDMLASEARIATFIAVARGELQQQGWFKMGRTHTFAFGRSILLSWTGTMFEYLMPNLWMRSYPDTLVSKSLRAAVEIHRAFAREHNIPWGISESGYAQKDDAGHYHYQAFGIPQIALKWDAIAGPVVSPYSTFLALGVDSVEALRNLRGMADRGWIGAYGFYEAADYSSSTKQAQLVREWMAHHQGMSILAVLNLLCEDKVQQWFHANPQFQAVELLLHEKPIREAALKTEQKKFTPPKERRIQTKKAS